MDAIMSYRAASLVLGVCWCLTGGCADPERSPAGDDGGSAAEASADGLAAPDPDTMPDADDDGAAHVTDAAELPFVAIAPCPTPEAFVTGATAVATLAARYAPPCLRIPVGASVMFEASGVHPIEARPLGTPGNPIPSRFQTTSVLFPAPGLFPYQCPEHVDEGMLGVIWVAPTPGR